MLSSPFRSIAAEIPDCQVDEVVCCWVPTAYPAGAVTLLQVGSLSMESIE